VAKTKQAPKEPSALKRAGSTLSAAVHEGIRATQDLETGHVLQREAALLHAQLTLRPIENALAAWKEALNETLEVEGVLNILATTTTPTGVDLETSLETLAFSTRAFNALKDSQILTVRDFCVLDAADLIKLRNCGRKTLDELAVVRTSLGLPLVGWS
jgi:DNA-directed RNA polymerase alpha subunit